MNYLADFILLDIKVASNFSAVLSTALNILKWNMVQSHAKDIEGERKLISLFM